MSQLLSEELLDIQKMAREFAETKLRPISKEWDLIGDTPLDLYRKAAELGYTSLDIPEFMGGAGLGALASSLMSE